MKDDSLPIPTTSLIHFSLKGRENVLFELGSETQRVTYWECTHAWTSSYRFCFSWTMSRQVATRFLLKKAYSSSPRRCVVVTSTNSRALLLWNVNLTSSHSSPPPPPPPLPVLCFSEYFSTSKYFPEEKKWRAKPISSENKVTIWELLLNLCCVY